jgi:putative oxidoreductase
MVARTDERLIIPGLSGLYERLDPLAYPMVRVVIGLWLIPHGAQKFGAFGGDPVQLAGFFSKIGLEPALPMVYAAGVVELLGGLLVAVGLLTRPAAVAAFILLAVATFKVHFGQGFFLLNGGYEYAMMWMLLMLAVVFKGGGRYSLDARLGRAF